MESLTLTSKATGYTVVRIRSISADNRDITSACAMSSCFKLVNYRGAEILHR
jgi:hypothetical protein